MARDGPFREVIVNMRKENSESYTYQGKASKKKKQQGRQPEVAMRLAYFRNGKQVNMNTKMRT